MPTKSNRSRKLFNLISSLVVILLAAMYFAIFEAPRSNPQESANLPPQPTKAPTTEPVAAVAKQSPFELLQETPGLPAEQQGEPAESEELPKDLQEQLAAPETELPDDLKAQLEEPEPELPDDLKAQLNAPPPELPEDIQRALAIPPRAVTLDEVNGTR